MTLRRALLLGTTFVLSLGLVAHAAAQGKKKPSSWPGTADFRCNGLTTPCPDEDLIVGDGSHYAGLGTPESGQGAHLRTNYEMWLGLRNPLKLFIDFIAQDPAAPCATGAVNYCQFPAAFSPANNILIDGVTYAEIQTNVVDDADDATPTLMDMSIGATRPIRVLISFNDPHTGSLWNFNFSKARASGATNASVRRSAACEWEITDGGGKAELSTLVRLQGKQFRSFEGLYTAPFLITFKAPGCPAAP